MAWAPVKGRAQELVEISITLMRITLSFLTFLCVCGGHAFAATLPNIVLLMGDDHGWEETGYHGHPHVKTPVLDQMAATGLRFSAAPPARKSAAVR